MVYPGPTQRCPGAAQVESPSSSVRFALQNGSDSDGGTPPASTQGAKLRRALSRTTIAPEGFPTEPADVAAAAPDAGSANGATGSTQQAAMPGSSAATVSNLSRTTIAPESFPTAPADVAAAAPDAGSANGGTGSMQQAAMPGSAAATGANQPRPPAPEDDPTRPSNSAAAAPHVGNADDESGNKQQAARSGSTAAMGPALSQLPPPPADAPAHAAERGSGSGARRDVLAGLAAASNEHVGPQEAGLEDPGCNPSYNPTPSAAGEEAGGGPLSRGVAPGGAAPPVALPHDVPEGVQRELVEPAAGARGPAHDPTLRQNPTGPGARPVEAPGTPPPVEPRGAAQGFGDPAPDPAPYPVPGPVPAEAPGTPPPPPPPARGVRERGMLAPPHAVAGWCAHSLPGPSVDC